MTTPAISPNVAARNKNYDRRTRDAGLARIAETQVRTPCTPTKINLMHFAMTEPNGDTLLSVPDVRSFRDEQISPPVVKSSVKKSAKATTTLLGKHKMAVVKPIQLTKVKPGF